MADLVTAVSSGGLSAVLAHGAPGEATMGPMAQLPLILIPAYLVPLLLMLHISALLQARKAAALVVNAPGGKERGLTLASV